MYTDMTLNKRQKDHYLQIQQMLKFLIEIKN